MYICLGQLYSNVYNAFLLLIEWYIQYDLRDDFGEHLPSGSSLPQKLSE